MEFALFHTVDAQDLKVVNKFLEKLCAPVIEFEDFCLS
jgi:hypothetical protein